MKILLTGAFGNLGSVIIEKLLIEGHKVTCFDIRNKSNVKIAEKYRSKTDIFWGDIRDESAVTDVVLNKDAIIHLAAVIAPFSELNPAVSYDVNVNGTRHLVDAAKAQHRPQCSYLRRRWRFLAITNMSHRPDPSSVLCRQRTSTQVRNSSANPLLRIPGLTGQSFG